MQTWELSVERKETFKHEKKIIIFKALGYIQHNNLETTGADMEQYEYANQ